MRGRGVLAALGMVLLVAGLVLVLAAGGERRAAPPDGWSSGEPRGIGGWNALLRHEGVRLRIVEVEDDDVRLLPRTTYLFAEGDLRGRALARRVREGVRDGARVVAVGSEAAALGQALGLPAIERRAGGAAVRVSRTAETRAVGQVADASAGWPLGALGDAEPLLRVGGDRAAAVRVRLGAGIAVLLADRGPVENRSLARADNAALAVALADDDRVVALRPRREVAGGGLGTRTTTVIALLVLGAVAALLARGRRLGPAVEPDEDPPPPRSAYVDALAAALERTDDPAAALAQTRRRAVALLRRREPLPPDADPAALRAAALRAGLDAREAAALLGDDDGDLIRAGRALARLETPTAGAPR